jgi:hypothetical protein
MKKVSLLCGLFILFITILAGCAKKDEDVIKHNYTFRGENELWKAELKSEGSYTFYRKKDGTLDVETESHCLLTVTYLGELSDLEKVRHYEIGYEATGGGARQTCDLEEGESITSKKFTIDSSTMVTSKDYDVTVTIIMDEEEQQLILKTK